MRQKIQVFIIPIFAIAFFVSMAKIIILEEQKTLLEDTLLEKVKALKIHQNFIEQVHSYIADKGEKGDKKLLATIEDFNAYMAVYSTPNQKGASKKFLKEVSESLRLEIETKYKEKYTHSNDDFHLQEDQ